MLSAPVLAPRALACLFLPVCEKRASNHFAKMIHCTSCFSSQRLSLTQNGSKSKDHPYPAAPATARPEPIQSKENFLPRLTAFLPHHTQCYLLLALNSLTFRAQREGDLPDPGSLRFCRIIRCAACRLPSPHLCS